MDEAALFLSDKSNAVSVNLARGKLTSETVLNVTLHEALTNFSFSDYVQVVDMGTLELRITAVKPGVDGKLVSVNYLYSHFKKNRQKTGFYKHLFSLSLG